MGIDDGAEQGDKAAEISATEAQKSTAATNSDINSTVSKNKKKRKRNPKSHILSQFTIRSPPWSYIHLQHLSSISAATAPIDAVTAHLHITAALSQFLGLHGAAIPVDILKTEGAEVWIRAPSEDRSALIAAVGGWVSGKGEGWRVMGSTSWDARANARESGQDLFRD